MDAIGGSRFSEGTSADREIQRTLMELLNQLDGFDGLGQVGVSCCCIVWGGLGMCGAFHLLYLSHARTHTFPTNQPLNNNR